MSSLICVVICPIYSLTHWAPHEPAIKKSKVGNTDHWSKMKHKVGFDNYARKDCAKHDNITNDNYSYNYCTYVILLQLSLRMQYYMTLSKRYFP